jgi:regulator of replication initiation timing
MQLFDIQYENPEDGDLYAISIVDSPANGMQFVALSEQAKKIQMADKKKQILTGVVLVPEQLIYREFEDGTPFNLKFSEDTILKLSQDFLRKGYQLNSTYNHIGGYLDGICVVEQWIVEDPMNDKANALGFEGLPKGTWMVSMKLSDELWSQYIETGKAKGFSIDSFLDLKQISMSIINNNKKINKEEKMSLLKKLIKMFSEENVNLATITIDGMGDLTADAFEVGNIVYADVEGAMQPLASQSFEYDGYMFTTDETGLIVDKVEVATTDTTVSGDTAVMASEDVTVEVGEDTMEDSPATETAAAIEDVADEVADEVVGQLEEVDVEALRTMIADLQAKLEILTKEKETITSENVAMKEQLSTIPNATKLKAQGSTQAPKQVTQMDTLREILAKAQK